MLCLKSLLSILACFLLIDASSASAQEKLDPPQRFVIMKEKVDLRLKEEVIGTLSRATVIEVPLIQGNWLWVPGQNGWVLREDVLTEEEALQQLSALVKSEPTFENYDFRGKVHVALRNYAAAIQDYDEAIRIAGEKAPASLFINRGNAWHLAKDYEPAIGDYNAALVLEPDNSLALINRSTIHLELQKYDEAGKDASAAIKIDNTNPNAWLNRGTALQYLGHLDKAMDDYNQAIKLNSEYGIAYLNRASLWEAKKQYEKARDDLRLAVKFSPNSVQANNNYAWLLATCPETRYRDPAKSIEHAMKACQLTAFQSFNELDTLAAAHAEAEKFDLAVKWMEKAIEFAPEEKKPALTQRLKDYQRKAGSQ